MTFSFNISPTNRLNLGLTSEEEKTYVYFCRFHSKIFERQVLPSTALVLRGSIEELLSASTCKDGVMQNTGCLVMGERLSSLGYFSILLEPQGGQVEVKIKDRDWTIS